MAGALMIKPSIVEVISQRVELRKAGKEFKALCPFHSERNPSFTVNEDKGLFYCFGCGASGDVFNFIMQLDGVQFPEARAQLGIRSIRPRRKAPDRVKDAAAVIANWVNHLTPNVNAHLRETGQRARVARLAGWRDEIDLLGREWMVLETLAEDLQDETMVLDLWRQRELIENLIEDVAEHPLKEEFPPLTAEYRAIVKSYAEVPIG
jgi:DNA primase